MQYRIGEEIGTRRTGRRPAGPTFRLILPLLLLALSPGAGTAAQWGTNHPGADWRVIETEHFRLIHPKAHLATARRAAAIAEESFGPVTRLVGGAPPGKVDIILRDWEDRGGGRSYSTWPRIEIEPYPLGRENAEIDFLRQVVVHEFAHVATYYAVGGRRLQPLRAPLALTNTPDWWIEGLPSALEKPNTEPRQMDFVRTIARSDELPVRARLDDIDQGDRLDRILIYWIGESKVRWLVERFGEGAVARVHHAMRPLPWSFDHALRSVTGMGEGELHEAWLADLRNALEEEPVPPTPRDRVPLPTWMERPLTFAYSERGDLAVVAVRDEDVWWPELYLRRAGRSAFERVEADPVWPHVSWTAEGRELLYARLTPGPSNADRHDLFAYDVESGGTERVTEGMRAYAFFSSSEGDGETGRQLALAYDETTGASVIVEFGDDPTGARVVSTPPADPILVDDPAAGSENLFSGLSLLPKGRRGLGHLVANESGFEPDRSAYLWRHLQPPGPAFPEDRSSGGDRSAAALFDPFREKGEGERSRSLGYAAYEKGLPSLLLEIGKDSTEVQRHALPDYVRDLSPRRNGGVRAITAAGRYGSGIGLLDLSEPIDTPRAGRIGWHHDRSLIEPPSGVPSEEYSGGRYSALGSIRPRPVFSIGTIDDEGVAFEVDDLLADPVEKHALSFDGSFDYDGDSRFGSAHYRNRLFLPTIDLRGRYGERRSRSAGVRVLDRSKSAVLEAHLPFRFESYAAWYELAAALSHARSYRNVTGHPESESRETIFAALLSRRLSRPRRATLLSLRYERGADLFHPAILPERFDVDATFRNALFRNDAFLFLGAGAAFETGGEKRTLFLAPPGIAEPTRFASGTRTLLATAGFAYPWSEDLGLPIGPIWFERLTHRTRFHEGRAWSDSGSEDRIRSLFTELDLTLFSARILPFLGTETLHLRTGYARELHDEGASEVYFAIESEWWNERWNGASSAPGESDPRRSSLERPLDPHFLDQTPEATIE